MSYVNIDLPKLESIELGDYSFGWSNTMKFESMNIESRYW